MPKRTYALLPMLAALLGCKTTPGTTEPIGAGGGPGGMAAVGGSSSAAGSSGSGNIGGSAAPNEIPPLPANAIPFLRGIKQPGSDRWLAQIWVYDPDTKDERLITRFGDDLDFIAITSRLAVSPDRKWIAFSAFFQPPSVIFVREVKLLWKVSADGQKFVRLTPPDDPRTPCRQSADCPGYAQMTCDQGRCKPFNWVHYHEYPIWTPDGSRVLFDIVENYCVQFGCTENGIPIGWGSTTLGESAMIDDRPGAKIEFPKTYVPNVTYSCMKGGPSMSPDGRRLAHIFSCGRGGRVEIGVSDVDGSNGLRLSRAEENLDFTVVRWHADNRRLFYTLNKGQTIASLDVESKQETLLIFADPGETLYNFALSPDGRWLVWSGRAQGKGVDLFQYDLTKPAPGNEVQRITTDGASTL